MVRYSVRNYKLVLQIEICNVICSTDYHKFLPYFRNLSTLPKKMVNSLYFLAYLSHGSCYFHQNRQVKRFLESLYVIIQKIHWRGAQEGLRNLFKLL